MPQLPMQVPEHRDEGPTLPPVNEPAEFNSNYILYWNHAGLELNRLTHSETIHGPQSGPPISARALGILHLAIHDAYFTVHPPADNAFQLYFGALDTSGADDARQAVAGAAVTVLESLYAQPAPNVTSAATTALENKIAGLVEDFGDVQKDSPSYKFGVRVGKRAFQELRYLPKGDKYMPMTGRYEFNDDPTNPVGRGYHEPFYGRDAVAFAVTKDHRIADPPPILSAFGETAEYDDSIKDIHRMGGRSTLATTTRSPFQSAAAYFWAYDGANLIGTPPRLYNQIVRVIAFNKRPDATDITSEANNAEFARLFALINTAMADAGKYSWREKYHFRFWRPLSGVRQDGRDGLGDPLWLSTGAPATNSADISFKPPFPAYPSGHATFGAAAFQMVRLFYAAKDPEHSWKPEEPDNIGFKFVSEEMNGISRDLYRAYLPHAKITAQSGDVRTSVEREFKSLWEAIFENAVSRVWLGVHWRFDAAAAKDILLPDPTGAKGTFKTDSKGATMYQNIEDIRYDTMGTREDMTGRKFPIGGVPLGIDIANDIFAGGMQPSPADLVDGGIPFGS